MSLAVSTSDTSPLFPVGELIDDWQLENVPDAPEDGAW